MRCDRQLPPTSQAANPKKRSTFAGVGYISTIIFATFLSITPCISQIQIRERISINGQTNTIVSRPMQISSGVGIGYIIPRGLRNWVQIYYGDLSRLHDSMYVGTKLNTRLNETTHRDTSFFDSLRPEFPSLLVYQPGLIDNCLGTEDTSTEYYYTPLSTSPPYDVSRVLSYDTLVFRYVTKLEGYPVTDTLDIAESTPITQGADTTTVGWTVAFVDTNVCLGTSNERLDMTIVLDCAHYTRLRQDSTAWKDSLYLFARDTTTHVRKTIKQKGCALTCMAMIGQAYGMVVNPGSLNLYMKNTYPFGPKDSALVRWDALDNWSGNNFFGFEEAIGDGLDAKNPTALQLSLVDSLVNMCYPLIAQVRNPTSGRNHWVIVRSKDSTGRYPIVDPGHAGNPYLDNPSNQSLNYGNKIYRLAVYSPN
jgi:hypothetical protein